MRHELGQGREGRDEVILEGVKCDSVSQFVKSKFSKHFKMLRRSFSIFYKISDRINDCVNIVFAQNIHDLI